MKSKFIIATDSACDLPLDYCKEHDIVPMKFNYIIDNEEFTDSMIPEEIKEFYDSMRNGKLPKTSQANIDNYISFWSSMDYENKPIIHVTMGSAISGTYKNGVLAKEMFLQEHPEADITVIDSTLSSIGHGMLLIKADEMRNSGVSAPEVANWIENTKKYVQTLVTTSDLKYLYLGGRVKKSKMMIANALNIRPILNLDLAGNLKVFDKARGEESTTEKIIKHFKELYNPNEETVYIGHADNIEKAKEFGEILKKEFGFKNVFYTYIGAIVGAHAGPGLIAVFYYGKPRIND